MTGLSQTSHTGVIIVVLFGGFLAPSLRVDIPKTVAYFNLLTV